MKYLVQYVLAYEHVVQVGVEADTSEEACEKAQAAFEAGDIWDDKPEMPLLLDDYVETDDRPLAFTVESECPDGYPDPDASVTQQKHDTAARKIARILIEAYKAGAESGSIEWSDLDVGYDIAVEAGMVEPTKDDDEEEKQG